MYSICYRLRYNLMENLMRFLQMYRNQFNMPLRMVLGGHFTLDVKMLQFRKFKHFCPVYKKSGVLNLNTFLFTKDNLMVVDHTKTLATNVAGKSFTDSIMEIVATETPSVVAIERPEKSIYHSSQVRKTEQFLTFSEASQARLGRKMLLKSAGLREDKGERLGSTRKVEILRIIKVYIREAINK